MALTPHDQKWSEASHLTAGERRNEEGEGKKGRAAAPTPSAHRSHPALHLAADHTCALVPRVPRVCNNG